MLTKAQVIEEIQDTHFTLQIDYEYECSLPKGLNSKKKNQLVELLIELRKEYFQRDSEAKAYIEEQTKRECDETYQAELSMADVLSSSIYQLSETVLERSEYSTAPDVDC